MRWAVVTTACLVACSPEQSLFDLSERSGTEVGFLLTITPADGTDTPGRILGPLGLQDGIVLFGDPPDFELEEAEDGTAVVLFGVDRLANAEPSLLRDQLSKIRLTTDAPPDPPTLERVAVPGISVLHRGVPDSATIIAQPASMAERARSLLGRLTLHLPADPEHCGGDAIAAFTPFGSQPEFRAPEHIPRLLDGALVSDSLAVVMDAGHLFILRRGTDFGRPIDTTHVLAASTVMNGNGNGNFFGVAALARPDADGRFEVVAIVGTEQERRVVLVEGTPTGFGTVRTATVVPNSTLSAVAGREDGRYLAASDDGVGLFGTREGTTEPTAWAGPGREAENERVVSVGDPEFPWVVDTRLAVYAYRASSKTWQNVQYPPGELLPRIGGLTAYRTPDGLLRIIVGSRRGTVFDGTTEGLESVILTMPPRFAACAALGGDDPSPRFALNNSDVLLAGETILMSIEDCNAILQVRPASLCVSLTLPDNEDFREVNRIERLVEKDGRILAIGHAGRVLTATVSVTR